VVRGRTAAAARTKACVAPAPCSRSHAARSAAPTSRRAQPRARGSKRGTARPWERARPARSRSRTRAAPAIR
jgi:hypothetical protein